MDISGLTCGLAAKSIAHIMVMSSNFKVETITRLSFITVAALHGGASAPCQFRRVLMYLTVDVSCPISNGCHPSTPTHMV